MDYQKIAEEFSNVINCKLCPETTGALRDGEENIPQPGFIGKQYFDYRILFIEKNPGPNQKKRKDFNIEIQFNKRLHELANSPNKELLFSSDIFNAYEKYLVKGKGRNKDIPQIFDTLKIDLDCIAHFNEARCRTKENKYYLPEGMRSNCETHFRSFIKLLKPKVVIFIGKGVSNKCKKIIEEYNILNDFLDRNQNPKKRGKNVYRILNLIKMHSSQLPTESKENFNNQLEEGIKKSLESDDTARKERLLNAPTKPQQVRLITSGFRRNPDVIVEVLKRANGKCEYCKSDAPFLRAKDNSPYLEIHHWTPLAEGGDDTIDNAGALCPNCHKKLHFGHKK
jgi:hypothetical protein